MTITETAKQNELKVSSSSTSAITRNLLIIFKKLIFAFSFLYIFFFFENAVDVLAVI